jgi:hypothetical protein
MKVRLIVFVIAVLVAAGMLTFTAAFAQEEENTRGAFLTTRPKKTDKPVDRTRKTDRKRPKTVVVGPPVKTTGSTTPVKTTGSTTPVKTVDAGPVQPRASKLGLGMTLFMRDSNGLSVRVDPSRTFRAGDRVRLLLETNADGFLYVFNTTDDGPPVMIYPDADLDEGGNYIQAHNPVEIPSSVAAEERLKWFRFDTQPGNERLYVVFSREPLSGIPLEEDLIKFCAEKNSNCPMKPPADLWAQIKRDLAPGMGAKAAVIGGVETESEHQAATTRGIGLSKEDPEPSLVMMTASSTASVLVTALDLMHK